MNLEQSPLNLQDEFLSSAGAARQRSESTYTSFSLGRNP